MVFELKKSISATSGTEYPLQRRLKTSISRMGFGVQPISDKVAQEQQYVADAFYAQKLIPNKLTIQEAILKLK